MKYTLGEVLSGERVKPVGSTCEEYAAQGRREPCGCGRGFIGYEYHGAWLPKHQAYTGGSNFGQLEMVACCEQCYYDQEAELEAAVDREWM